MVSKRVELLDVINRSSALALDGEAQKNAKGWVGCFRLVADARAARANEYYRPEAALLPTYTMNSLREFEHQLFRLDPAATDFLLRVDELVEAVPESDRNEGLIEPIFAFFEAHPLDDMGEPGTLVHLTEGFYPSYTERLLDSLRTQPSYNAILMANRILNGRLSDQERSKYMSALVETAKTPDLPRALQDLVHRFLERRRKLDAES